MGSVRTYFKTVVTAFVVALLLRGCVVQGFKVPSGSMLPTLQVGDYILASRIDYGIPRPVLRGWLWRYGSPRPGEIVVFGRSAEPDRLYVKRVAAVAGEIVEVRDGQLTVDGHQRDILPDWVHTGRLDDFGPIRVPPGRLFVLGDNRDQSIDSRSWGPVDSSGIKGRVFLIYWSQSNSGGGVRWERLGSRVQ